jgi:hypothetical protein
VEDEEDEEGLKDGGDDVWGYADEGDDVIWDGVPELFRGTFGNEMRIVVLAGGGIKIRDARY